MLLFILLVCLAIQTYFDIHPKKDYLFTRYIHDMKSFLDKVNLTEGWGVLIGLMLPILIGIAILNLLFIYVWLFYLIFGIIVLLFCLDTRDLKLRLAEYFAAAQNNNLEKAQVEAAKFVNHPVSQDRVEISRAVTQQIFLTSLTHIFSVIFWFFILGPFGAVLYSLTAAIYNQAERGEDGLTHTLHVAEVLKNILDWIPVRLVVLTYALIGHFGPVSSIWIQRLGSGLNESRQFIIDAGITALNIDLLEPLHSDLTENYQALNLTTRALWTWVIVIAVLTIAVYFFR